MNVTTGIQSDDGVTALVFLQPAVDGRIFATVEAENAFGSAGVSSSAEDDISKLDVFISTRLFCLPVIFFLKKWSVLYFHF